MSIRWITTLMELSSLLGRINRQHTEIDRQLKELRRRTDEFTQITGSMREGLVLLDERGYVLSINATAKEIFGADDGSAGQDFLTIDRSGAMSGAVQAAMRDGHAEISSERAGRDYSFDLTRIESGGRSIGTVILAFDVTEQEQAERMRREFTANVSHELEETPFRGSSAARKAIENGLVKPEDMPRFVGHIHSEASRLMALISDIIRLSQLDEGEEMPRESVDLYDEAAEAEENLRTAAEEKGVKLSLTGEGAEISGVRRLVYEIIYNLCDNAIKYNCPGGSVEVRVTQSESEAAVTVADTGIGIAPEDQARVFERFYRADKSRSKESGGTGLGLSIVKHAVQYHHGSIDLKSNPGEGTTIKVTFPK
ncbi:MAG: ATP-binding protein [Oscillospiraceae bacterium]